MKEDVEIIKSEKKIHEKFKIPLRTLYDWRTMEDKENWRYKIYTHLTEIVRDKKV